jgi:energy-coupling factor transport system ATP-binding protein
MDEAALADRILVADGGKIILDGAPEEVFEKHELLSEAGLEVPQATELVRRLFEDGRLTQKTVLDTESAAKAIMDSLLQAGK